MERGSYSALVFQDADLLWDLNGGGGLPLSKARHMVAELAFRFSREYVERSQAWASEDETRDEVWESEDETEFVDAETGEWRFGRRLHRCEVPTGDRRRRAVAPAEVLVPSVLVGTRAAAPGSAALDCRVRVFRTGPLGARVGNELRFSEGMAGLVWAP